MRVPDELFGEPYNLRSLQMDGCTVVESCSHGRSTTNEMVVSQHLILFVLEGRYIGRCNDAVVCDIVKNQAVLVQKAHRVRYEKIGYLEHGKPYESLLFFLSDALIHEFLQMKSLQMWRKHTLSPFATFEQTDSMQAFVRSVMPYFENKLSYEPALMRIKLFELLFNLVEINPALLQNFTQFAQAPQHDVLAVMEAHFAQNLHLEDYASMAGGSLASFKRDFQKVSKTTPHKWLLEKRLTHAKYLLENTHIKVSDACFASGFESLAHFSRVFKQHFGANPSSVKTES
jgi:AraC family transcriptional regulator, exoenzyme S synthesis regulatory protein ExsA